MFNNYIKEHTNLDSSQKAWEHSWQKQASGATRIIDVGRRVYNHFLFLFLEKYIGSEVEFLEFGCGTASLGLRLAPRLKSYTGWDIAANALKEAEDNFRKSGLNNFRFEMKDVTDFKSEKKFDVVWSQGLAEHFQEPHKLINAHLQACKEGGRVLVSVPARNSYHHLWYLLTRPKQLRRFWPWPDEIFISKKMFGQYMAILEEKYRRYHVTFVRPRILGLSVLVIEK